MKAVQLKLALRFVFIVECADARKSMHNLERDRYGWFKLRLTVYRGPLVVGKRIKRALKTKDPVEARRIRDAVIRDLTNQDKISQRVISQINLLKKGATRKAGSKKKKR